MKNSKVILSLFLVALLFHGVKVFAQGAEELYQEGIQLEEVKGEIDEAIDVFSKVLKEKNVDKETASMAQLHIGLCYQKLGEEKIAEAISAFRKVISLYPAQRDAVKIAREKLASLDSDEADIQEIENTLIECDKAFESKDVDSYCSFFSNEFISGAYGNLEKMKKSVVYYYFSKWKIIALASKIISVDKTGYNYVADDEVDFNYTDWENNTKGEMGVHRYLTFTKEDGKWKILSYRNQLGLPAVYRSLRSDYHAAGRADLAYVCHITQRIVSVIDTRTDSLIGIIPSGNGSCDIAFSKDKGYIANFSSDSITIFYKETNKEITSVPVGQHPCNISIVNDGKLALISHQSEDGLWIMSTKDNQVLYKIPGIDGMTLSDTSNKKIYACAVFQPFIYVIDANDGTAIKKIEVGGRPLDIAITPDGKFIYEANVFLNVVQKIDTEADSVVKIITDIDSCRGIAISPNGKYAYATNVMKGTVTVIDLKTDTKIKTLQVGRTPTSIDVDKNNDCAYVSNQGGSSLSVIDMTRNEVVKTISVADNPNRVRIY